MSIQYSKENHICTHCHDSICLLLAGSGGAQTPRHLIRNTLSYIQKYCMTSLGPRVIHCDFNICIFLATILAYSSLAFIFNQGGLDLHSNLYVFI